MKAISFAIALAAALWSWHEWRLAGAVLPDDRGEPIVRTRFLALLGAGLGAISALVIFAEWMTAFVIPPCVR